MSQYHFSRKQKKTKKSVLTAPKSRSNLVVRSGLVWTHLFCLKFLVCYPSGIELKFAQVVHHPKKHPTRWKFEDTTTTNTPKGITRWKLEDTIPIYQTAEHDENFKRSNQKGILTALEQKTKFFKPKRFLTNTWIQNPKKFSIPL